MQALIRFTLVVLSSMAVLASASAQDMTMDKPSFYASETATVSAVVEEINHETRVVTVKKSDGELLTFTATEEARNLDQVSVGDVLVAQYQETISIEVFDGNGMEPEVAEAVAVARAEEGQMPGFAAMDTRVATATVEEINIEANTFKLKGVDGGIREYTARNPENLKRASVGNLVVLTVTEALAIEVAKQP